jgi:hypothetical protein
MPSCRGGSPKILRVVAVRLCISVGLVKLVEGKWPRRPVGSRPRAPRRVVGSVKAHHLILVRQPLANNRRHLRGGPCLLLRPPPLRSVLVNQLGRFGGPHPVEAQRLWRGGGFWRSFCRRCGILPIIRRRQHPFHHQHRRLQMQQQVQQCLRVRPKHPQASHFRPVLEQPQETESWFTRDKRETRSWITFGTCRMSSTNPYLPTFSLDSGIASTF